MVVAEGRKEREARGWGGFYLRSHMYYSLHLEITIFISAFPYREYFATLSVKYLRLMWPKPGIMHLSFAMRRTCLRQSLKVQEGGRQMKI